MTSTSNYDRLAVRRKTQLDFVPYIRCGDRANKAIKRVGGERFNLHRVVVVVFTLKAVPISTQYFLTSVLVQLTRTPSVVTG